MQSKKKFRVDDLAKALCPKLYQKKGRGSTKEGAKSEACVRSKLAGEKKLEKANWEGTNKVGRN